MNFKKTCLVLAGALIVALPARTKHVFLKFMIRVKIILFMFYKKKILKNG